MDQTASFFVYFSRWIKENQISFSRLWHPLPDKMLVLDFESRRLKDFFFAPLDDKLLFSDESWRFCQDRNICSRMIARSESIEDDFDYNILNQVKDLPVPMVRATLDGARYQEIRFALFLDDTMVFMVQLFWKISGSAPGVGFTDGPVDGLRATKWVQFLDGMGKEKEYLPEGFSFFSAIDSFISVMASDFFMKSFFSGFVPLFPVSSGDYRNINLALMNRKSFHFLNGQKGTGRLLFFYHYVRIHYLYDLNSFIAENFLENAEKTEPLYLLRFNSGKIEKIHFSEVNEMLASENPSQLLALIPELLQLDRDSQDLIYEILQKFNDPTECSVFVLSSFDLSRIQNTEILHPDLQKLCLDNREVFPSYSSICSRSYGDSLIAELIGGIALGFQLFLKHEQNTELWKSRLDIENAKGKRNFFDLFYKSGFPKDTKKGQTSEAPGQGGLREFVAEAEKNAILYAYENVARSQQEIADYLGISRGSLQHKLRKYKLRLED